MTLIKNHTNKIAKKLIIISAFLFIFVAFSFNATKPTIAHDKCCNCGTTCAPKIINCSVSACECQSNKDTPVTIKHITDEFIQHREWMIKILWEAHVLPSMMLMTEQISALAMHQMLVVGSFFDAKHQLETQRLLQQMQAQAHKDYQPSKGMCTFGTTTRSLAASERNTNFTQTALASRALQRQLLSGDTISSGGRRDDATSRMVQFKTTYCNPADFGDGLGDLCLESDKKRFNKDINFTHTIDSAPTLEIDLTKSEATKDSEDVMALSANLYGHKIFPRIPEDKMAQGGKQIDEGAFIYMKIRSLIAKRSVAQAAYNAQAAMRAQGEKEVQPYMEAILKEMGIEEDQIKTMLGNRPSYYAQMELLTKKLYQTPNFYTELYDKPTNIDRKNVSMQAIGLMQKRDMFHAQQRNEAITAVLLETSLDDLESLYINEARPMKANSLPLNLPGLD